MTPGGRGASHSRRVGTVLTGVGGVYRVRLDDGSEGEAPLRGRLKLQTRTGDRVVPGDRVVVERVPAGEGATEEALVVEEVLPRRNELARAGARGRGAKVVAANLDRVAVVVSASEPAVPQETIDRFLAIAGCRGIPPILVLNKVDLEDADARADQLAALYRSIGYPVLLASARTAEGVDELRALLSNGVSALIGPSGVGKSTLLNAIDPTFELRTGRVSDRGGRGRHTTVSASLLPLPGGGWVVDTPGFSEARLLEGDRVHVAEGFPEFESPSERCRFRGCTHLHEPGCQVQAALVEGRIHPSRFASYRAIIAEGR